MPKRTTRAQIILNDTKKRIEVAEMSLREHTIAADRARDTLALLRQIYSDLEKQLAPKSRGKAATATKKKEKSEQPTLTAAPDGDLPEACLNCGGDENAADHFAPSPNFHNYTSSAKSKAA